MIYQGIFEDINGNRHLLRIGTTGEVQTLNFGGSPFVTSMDESDGNIYTPVKCQAGTIGLVAVDTDYMFGLYTGDAHGMPVTLYKGEVVNPAKVEWVGYVTPSLYDIGYTHYVEDLDVDCVDGLATLEQYKYKPIGTNAEIVSLLDLVRHCVAKCGCYSMMVLSTATKLGSSDARDLWQSCRISERNFLSQDKEEKDGEGDKTYKEVLESVCMWMGVTAMAYGDTVYFIDYDALQNASANTSIIVDVAGGNVTTGTMALPGYTITGSSYASADTNLSLDKVYTKVTVKDELNEYDDILGDIFDGAENITADDPTLRQNKLPTSLILSAANYYQPTTGDNILYAILKSGDYYSAVFLKYYKPKGLHLYNYTTGSGNPSTSAYANSVNYTNTQNADGAFLVRAYVVKLNNTDPWDWSAVVPGFYTRSLEGLININDIHSVTFDDYIFMTNHSTNHISNANQASFPYFRTDNSDNSALFGGVRGRLVISGEIIWHMWDEYMYPVPEKIDYNGGRNKVNAQDGYLLAKLEWGNQFWNGRTWVNSNTTTFKLPYLLREVTYDDIMYNPLGIVNNVTWTLGTDASGYAITMPHNGSILYGKPALTIYKPTDMGVSFETVFLALKNFKIEAVITNPNFDTKMDEDTVYTNIIDTRNAEEMDEITFSVTTWDNKKPNLSSVAYVDANNADVMRWVDTTYHTALAADETGSTRYDGSTSDGTMRQEEHMVFRLVQQYSEPAKVLDITMNEQLSPTQIVTESNLNTAFIVDKINVDYRYQQFTYKLIEKK